MLPAVWRLNGIEVRASERVRNRAGGKGDNDRGSFNDVEGDDRGDSHDHDEKVAATRGTGT